MTKSVRYSNGPVPLAAAPTIGLPTMDAAPPDPASARRPPTTVPGHYPVVLVVAARPVLVVGGGPVAARKVAGLAGCGALVTVVASEPGAELGSVAARWPGQVQVHRRAYRAGEAADYRLVVTATGIPGVDRSVAADADLARVWVNSADDMEHCTFLLPSVHRDGPVTVAVSTGGTSPALAAWLRRRLGRLAGPSVGALARFMGESRAALQADGLPTSHVDWHALLDGDLPDLVARGRLDEARALVRGATAAGRGS